MDNEQSESNYAWERLQASLPAPTAEESVLLNSWDRGYEDAVAGRPQTPPDDAKQALRYTMAYKKGDTDRRVDCGEAIQILGIDTYCPSCDAYNYGQRLGCRCGGTVQYKLQIRRAEDSEHLDFNEAETVLMSGLPVFDVMGDQQTVSKKDGELHWEKDTQSNE